MVTTFQAKTAIRATGLAMLSMLVLLALTLVVESYNSNRTKANIAVHRAAHVVATQYDWMFEASSHALQSIEETIISLPLTGTGVAPLGALPNDLPAGFSYSVFDAAGNLTHSSLSDPTRTNVADTAHFRSARNGTELELAQPHPANAARAADFLMVRRIDKSGSFAGIATVTIPVSTLTSLAETLGIGKPSTIALVRSDGALLARSPPVQPMSLAGWQLFTELETALDGSFEAISPADGVERIIGYWHLRNWPVVALAGFEHATAMRPFWRNLFTAAILALPVLLGVGWLLLDLVHLMRVDEKRQIALTDAIERTNFLLREIHHRLKNNLQTVSSLIRLENLAPAVQSSLLGRIGAMVAVHEAMYRSDQFDEICIAPYLERLIENISKSQGFDVATCIDIAAIRLSGDRAMQLGLLVNELVTNAFKHAFAAHGTGTLNVLMHESENGRLRLVVADDGPGYDQASAPTQMGSRLIEAFASQLGGTVRIESHGATTVTVDFPKDYGSETLAPQRSAQPTSIAGARSSASIRLSKFVRSSKRT